MPTKEPDPSSTKPPLVVLPPRPPPIDYVKHFKPFGPGWMFASQCADGFFSIARSAVAVLVAIVSVLFVRYWW